MGEVPPDIRMTFYPHRHLRRIRVTRQGDVRPIAVLLNRELLPRDSLIDCDCPLDCAVSVRRRDLALLGLPVDDHESFLGALPTVSDRIEVDTITTDGRAVLEEHIGLV